MMPRVRQLGLAAAAAGAVLWAAPTLADDNGVFVDAAGDAVVRPTDSGGAGTINPNSLLPDLLSVVLRGWVPGSVADPFSGFPTNPSHAHVFRMDVKFAGRLNPPGPLGLGGEAYDPFRYGPSPVYGFIELDLDRNRDTGGELGGAATHRYLANVGRFGGLPEGSIASRAARWGPDIDFNFDTGPQYERSGADFALTLCGCSTITVVSAGGNGDLVFDSGETWIVRSRFFQRSGGYREASSVQGGSAPGTYDPMVNLRWSHNATTNETTVSLIYALDMLGASMLTGQPQQPVDNMIDVGGNHHSVVEALVDLINAANAGGLVGPVYDLTDDWTGRNAWDQLDCTRWRASALVGTAYESSGTGLYVWTDIGFGNLPGDCNGDGVVNSADRLAVMAFIAAEDGGPNDADNQRDGSVNLIDPGANFSIYDVGGDRVVDSADLAFFPMCNGDFDQDGQILPQDVSLFVGAWLNDLSQGTLVTDIDNNGAVQPADISLFVQRWFACLP